MSWVGFFVNVCISENKVQAWFHLTVPTFFRAKENTNSEAEEFDQSAAFFTKVVSKKKKAGSIPEQPAGGKGKSKVRDNKGKDEDVSTDPSRGEVA